jgi:hypothetical protein
MRKLILLLLFCASSVAAQNPLTYQSSATGNITATGSTCATTNACLSVHLPPGSTSVAVTVTGTWSATLVVEMAADNGVTWVSAGTGPSANGQTTYTLTAQTDFRVRCSAFTSGTVGVFINVAPPTIVNLGPIINSSSGGVGSGAAPVMAYYFSNACPVANTSQCYFAPSNTQLANDCTWASTGTTVTCATSHFAASDVGKRVAGYFKTDAFGAIFGCVAGRISFSSMTTGTLTIASFSSATQIALSGNPANTATSNNGCLIWGNPDDSNAVTFETAYAAVSGFCPKVMLASAGYWFSSPHFTSQPVGCAALPASVGATLGNMVYTSGFELEGRGPGNTTIYLGPDFPVAGGNLCTNSEGNITNACFLVPVEGKWSDLQISGGGQLACQVGSTKILLGVSVGTLQNITLTNFCGTGGQIGIEADLLSQLYQINDSGFGSTCLQTVTSQGAIQAFKLACENSPAVNLDIRTGGPVPTFTCFGCLLLGAISSGNMNVIQVASGAEVHLIGSQVANCESGSGCSTTGTTLVKNNGGTIYISDGTLTQQGGVSGSGGVTCFVAGCKTFFDRTNLVGVNYGDIGPGTMYDLGGNSNLFSGSTQAGELGTIQADGRSAMFSCTGTANASITNSLYGTGPNVTATTCVGQTATLGAGIPFQQARTIVGVICTSSATTVSVACKVMVNGSAASTTCTMTAATRCGNFTTTAVNQGDLLSAEIITGAAETGANIKMQVIWQ